MVLYILCIKGDLEGVQSVALNRAANICISVRATNGDETREKVVFNPSETLDQDESDREPAHHFALTWEGQKKKSIIQVRDEAQVKATMKKAGKKKKGGGGGLEVGQPREMTADDSGEYVPVLALECRGLEPYAFHPMGEEFVVTSEGGAEFSSDLTLDEGDWCEFDEASSMPVGISEFDSKFESV